ncbi:MAG: phosphoribosylglycinamide formyltransferase [Ignavibacteria bacterium]
MNICVFASGSGSNFRALLEARKSNYIKSEFKLLITNNSRCGAVDIAKEFDVESFHISRKVFHDLNDSDYAKLFSDLLDKYSINLIVLAGYMKMIEPAVIRKFKNRIINIHPALLPSFGGKGMYGMNVHKAVIDSGAKESGVTIHLVDEIYDNGRILLQEKVNVDSNDDELTLQKKVLTLEHKYFKEVIKQIEEGKLVL